MTSEVVPCRSLSRPRLILVFENSRTRTGPGGVILGFKIKIYFDESNNDFGIIFHIISNFLSVTTFENDYFAFLDNTCFWPIFSSFRKLSYVSVFAKTPYFRLAEVKHWNGKNQEAKRMTNDKCPFSQKGIMKLERRNISSWLFQRLFYSHISQFDNKFKAH